MRAAFQGEFGAFSEQAVHLACGTGAQAIPRRTLREAYGAVADGAADVAVIPVENSRAGTIAESYDLLLDSGLVVRGEVAVRVDQCLLAPPGTALSAVRRVYSHPQALAQCEGYLRDLGLEAIAVYDTAGSARQVAAGTEPGAAAIASRRAAALYGLEVLADAIQDDRENTTRFYVIGPAGPALPEPSGPPRTLLALALADDDAPGALFWSLSTLAFWRLNLRRIESRPSRLRPWHYQFYLEVDAAGPACLPALAELGARGVTVRNLGSFSAAGPAV